MDVPNITQSTSPETKRKLVLSAKVTKKIAVTDAIKDLQKHKIHISESGEEYTTTARILTEVPPPCSTIPTDKEFFVESSLKPDLEFLRNHLFNEGRVSLDQAKFIVNGANELLKKEPNVLDLEAPLTVCGDIHGQFYDLIRLLEVGGDPASNRYLFMGDYVDRGYFSIECVLYLYALKICYPQNVYLLRGNHESKRMTEYFTFKTEVIHKYDQSVYELCLKSFCSLPLAAIMNKQFFCVHGGISPELKTIDDVQKLNRFTEPPATGLMCDLLWSDPSKDYGNEPGSEHFAHNGARGCSYYYTYKGVCAFLDKNKLLCLIRAHEVQEQGYTIHKANKSTGFPSLMTIFSAPHYLDAYKNKGAILAYTDNINIKQFNASPHPYWLPDFMDVFSWSLPFVGTKFADMLIAILSICSEKELGDETSEEAEADREVVRSKVKAIARIQNYFNTLRASSETIAELKNKMGTEKLPPGYLHLGSVGIRELIESFADAQIADQENERCPPEQ